MSEAAAPIGSRDTIVAIATPPGLGAIGVIRVSGSRAWACVQPQIATSTVGDLSTSRPRVLRRVRLVDPCTGDAVDDALVAYMPGPHSYTGENIVELSCHGNPLLLAEIVQRIVSAGARLAEPGEFTRRAYLGGRMDLIQAESVALLIEARTARAARLAMRQIAGEVSRQLQTLGDQLIALIASLEITIDFPEEGYAGTISEARAAALRVRERIAGLLEGTGRGRAVYSGLTVSIAGAPNVGKSSLLNALLGRDRAIVSSMPGTTRDIVEGTIVIEGITVRLIDGAGVGVPRDAIDEEGMARSRAAMTESDLVLVVLDRSRGLGVGDREVLRLTESRPRRVVANKADLPDGLGWSDVDCECSTLGPGGVDSVRRSLTQWVTAQTVADAEEGGIVVSLRVGEQLDRAQAAMDRSVGAMSAGLPVEVALVELREAHHALAGTVGDSVSEQVLDQIFARFCVGK